MKTIAITLLVILVILGAIWVVTQPKTPEESSMKIDEASISILEAELDALGEPSLDDMEELLLE